MPICCSQVYDPTIGNTYVMWEKNTPLNGTRPIALYHHGFTQDGWLPINAGLYGQYAVVAKLVQMGYIVASSDYGGQLWGNANDRSYQASVMEYVTSFAGYTAAFNATVGSTTFRGGYLNTGKKFLMTGTSMGGLSVLNFTANFPLYVGAVGGFIPVCDLNNCRQINPTFVSSIDSCYGGTYDDNLQGPTNNPNKIAQSNPVFDTIPIYLTYGGLDVIVPPAVITTFAGYITARAPNAPLTLQLQPSTGHDEDTPGLSPLSKFADFCQRYVPVG